MHRYIPRTQPADVAAVELRLRRTTAGPGRPSERWWNWAIAERERPGIAIGTVEATVVDNGARALLGYQLARAFWGRGYAFEAAETAIAFLRERSPVRRIEATIDVRNARSIALAERLGFSRDATRGGDHLYVLALEKDGYGETDDR